MGSVYQKKGWLYLRVKDASGRWVARSTGLPVGAEAQARELLRAAEAALSSAAELGLEEGTVAAWAAEWIRQRRRRGLAMVRDDERNLRLYLLPALGSMKLDDVRPRHVRRLVGELSARPSAMGGTLAPRTVRSIYGTLRGLMADAVREELTLATPCVLGRADLPKLRDKDPEWRGRAVFSRDELELLISDDRINALRRVSYALLGLAGLRWGEAAALRWRAYDRAQRPLGRLTIAAAASDRRGGIGTTKSEVTRYVPVHPALARVLAEWRGGWESLMGRRPKGDDLVLPAKKRETRRGAHALQWLYEDCDRLELRRRRIHDLRRTFVSLAQADGATPDQVRWLTHTPGGIVALYTTLPWDTLCGVVSPIRVSLRGRSGLVTLVTRGSSSTRSERGGGA